MDAIRSTRAVRVELDGVRLAESSSPVMVFETGPPTRYYLNRSEANFDHLIPTQTQAACPYKGNTSGYWSIRIGQTLHADRAWAYDFPTRQLQPIAGLIAFYNQKVDIYLDGDQLERPTTHLLQVAPSSSTPLRPEPPGSPPWTWVAGLGAGTHHQWTFRTDSRETSWLIDRRISRTSRHCSSTRR